MSQNPSWRTRFTGEIVDGVLRTEPAGPGRLRAEGRDRGGILSEPVHQAGLVALRSRAVEQHPRLDAVDEPSEAVDQIAVCGTLGEERSDADGGCSAYDYLFRGAYDGELAVRDDSEMMKEMKMMTIRSCISGPRS